MRRAALLVLVAWMGAACTASDPVVSSLSAEEAELAGLLTAFGGEWRWLASEGSIAGVRRTPETEAFTAIFRYEATGIARTFRNDSLIDVSRYEPIEPPAGAQEGSRWVRYDPPLNVLPFGQMDQHSVEVWGKLNLQLAEPCCDRYVHTVATTAEIR